MLLFVGKKEKGFFTEETGEKVEYIDDIPIRRKCKRLFHNELSVKVGNGDINRCRMYPQ